MTERPRKALHAFLSDEAHEQWHSFAGEFGVSVSAILEVLGKHLVGGAHSPQAMVSEASIEDFVADARRIDATRRRRTRA